MNWDETGSETDEPTGPVLDDRLVDADADGEDTAVEAALRPKDLDEFVGQEKVREQLDLVLKAARARGATADHVLLSGAPGLGKTTLSMIIAAEMNAPIRITSGPAIQHVRRSRRDPLLPPGGRGPLPRRDPPHVPARRGDAVHGDGGLPRRRHRRQGPRRHRHPAGTAAVHPGRGHHPGGTAAAPLRDRFGFTGHMEFYAPAELERVIHRSARLLDVGIDADGAAEIAGRSRGTPRIANRLLRRVRDYAQVKAEGMIDREIAAAALKVYEVDARGLDRLDRAVLGALLKLFGGGPVGLSTLAVAVGEERETVEEVAEPFLVREGLLARTPRGRVATPAAWAHLGLVPPTHGAKGQQGLFGA